MTKDSDHSAGTLEAEKTGLFAEENQFDRRTLLRIGTWGVAAVGAVVVAVMANQTSLGLRRDQLAAADLSRQAQLLQSTARDNQNETRRLAAAIDTLNTDRDRLFSRVTVLEQGLDTATGTIGRQPAGPQAGSPAPVIPRASAMGPVAVTVPSEPAEFQPAPAAQAALPAIGPVASATPTPPGAVEKPRLDLARTDAKTDAKAETKAEVKPDIKSVKPELKPEAKAETKSELKLEAKPPEVKSDQTAGSQVSRVKSPEVKSSDAKSTEAKSSETKLSEAKLSEAKSSVKPDANSDAKVQAGLDAKPDSRSDQLPHALPSAAQKVANTAASTAEVPASTTMTTASVSMMGPPDPAAPKLEPLKSATAGPAAAPMSNAMASAPAKANDSPDAASGKPAVQRTEFAVDLGTANSVNGLRALWRGLRSNANLAELHPIIMIKEGNTGLGMQLRLAAGPLRDAAAAAKICAALVEGERTCETTVYDGQRLAMSADEPQGPLAKPAAGANKSYQYKRYPPRHTASIPKREEPPAPPPQPPKPEPSSISTMFKR